MEIDKVYFTVDSDGADQLLHENFKRHVDYKNLENGDVIYVMPHRQFDRFVDLATSTSQEYGNSIEEVDDEGYPVVDKAGLGKKIKITTEGPKLVSFWDIYGKELDVKDTKTVNFASGPKTFYIAEFEGREYEVPEDMVEKRTNKELSECYWKKAEALEEELASDRGGETSGMNYERAERLQKEMDYYRNLSIELEGKASNGKEVTTESQNYSWGTLRRVKFGKNGIDGSAIIHPENWDDIKKLQVGEGMTYKDEQGILWNVHKTSPSKYMFKSMGGHGLNGEVELFDEEAGKGKKVDLGIAIKGEFTTDGENYFSGWYFQSQDWNGFKVPYFEDKEARDVIESLEGLSVGRLYGGKLSDKGWWYAEPGTAPVDRTVVTGQKIQTTDGEKEVWAIGGFEWTWGLKDEQAGNGSQIKRVGIYTDEKLEELAKRHFTGLETLQTRKMDSLDFHNVAVWQIKAALKEAGRDMLSDSELTKIAQNHLYLDTLATRNSDGLDFSEQSVWGLKDALKEANYKGVEKLRKAGDGTKIEKMEIKNKYYYLPIGRIFKDSGGVRFQISGYTPEGLKIKRYSEVEKDTAEAELSFGAVPTLAEDKKITFEGATLETWRDMRLLELEIDSIKKQLAWMDSRNTYQAELEQAADKIDKLNAELYQVKKEANTLMDDIGKKSSGFKDSLDAMEAIATKNKFIKADDAFDILKAKGAKKLRTSSDGINYISTSGSSRLLFRKEELGHRYVDKKELEDAIKNIGNIKAPTNREVPKEIDEVITRKPSDWNGIDAIDSTLVQKHITFFKALPEYKITAENPMDDLGINYTEPFIGKLGRDIYLIVPEGYKYARYAGDITDAWTVGGKAGKGKEVEDGREKVFNKFKNRESFTDKDIKSALKKEYPNVLKGDIDDMAYSLIASLQKYESKASKGTQVSPCTDCDTKLKAFIAKFPNNAKSWAQATDEMRDLARELREYYNEQNDLSEGQKGYIDGLPFREFKTPSEWNTKAKKQILSTWKKLSKEQKEAFASNNSFLNPDND